MYLAEDKFTGSLPCKLCRSITATSSAFGGCLLGFGCFVVNRMNLMEHLVNSATQGPKYTVKMDEKSVKEKKLYVYYPGLVCSRPRTAYSCFRINAKTASLCTITYCMLTDFL